MDEHRKAPLPAVPLTMEGSWVLHQMIRFDWSAWRAVPKSAAKEVAAEFAAEIDKMGAANTALFSLVGHKGDFMVVHFRKHFDELNDAEVALTKSALGDFMTVVHSYVSVVELGLYESSVKTYQALTDRGVEPYSDLWDKKISETVERQRTAMGARLYPEIPPARYVCFYPMDRRRGEEKNWYMLPIQERQRQMHEHGLVGRRYAGEVRQIITGSVGFDDWEWGVTLFAEDPLVFKKLIYDMRFDEVSAVYAEFGEFFTGIRRQPSELGELLAMAE
ncbi:MAG TPA: hydrogen peroxide-dependent heme synthase [Bryobacteraceae bacterium]